MGNKLDKAGLTYLWGKIKSFFVKGNARVFVGTCDTAAGTVAKAVTCADFTSADLVAGTIITVRFSATNTGAVGSLTLNVNGTGAKNIKYIYNGSISNIPAAGYLKANQMYQFYYDGTYWVVLMIYNTNTAPTYLGHQNYVLAKTAITAESLIVGDASGYSRVAAGVTFDLSFPILWCTVALNAAASNYANMYLCMYDRNIATGAKTGFTSVKNRVIYLIVTVSGNVATIDSDIITDSLPTTDDGKVYIALGKLGNQSTGANYFLLYPEHPMFIYKNGAVRVYSGNADLVNGHTVNSDVPANAKFTDTTYTEASTTAAGLMSASDKTKLNGIDDGAEVNQDAYGKVGAYNSTGSVLYSDTANAKTDTMVLLEGTNVELSSETMYLGGEYVNALKISANDPAYDTMTQAQANAGTITAGKLISPKVLNDTITGKVGTNFTETSGSTVSAANNAWTKVQSVTLAAGTYLVKFGVSFASNATGYRSICLTVGSETATLDRYAPTQNAVSGRATDMMDTEVVVLTAQTTVNVHAFHTAGTALNTYPFIKTLKLK